MRHPRIAPALLASAALLAAAGACRERDRKPVRETTPDSALAADLRRASGDTSAYGEAADVATATVPDSVLEVPATPPPMMETGTATRPSTRAPAASTPTAVPAPARTRVAAKEAPLEGVGCESPALTDQKRCLMAYLARSDLELDRAYQAVIAEMKRQSPPGEKGREPEIVRKLRVQERAWLVYRDTECRRLNRGKEGPLWAPVRARCLGEFSAHRAEQLREALARMRQR
jgi:uncharacterized protein YecT (DUF1311 family)